MPQRQPGFRVRCKECGKILRLKPELRGKKIRCPQCSHVISLKRTRPKRHKPSPEFTDSPKSLDWNELADLENKSVNYSRDEYDYFSEELPPPPPSSVLGRSSRTRSRGRSLPPGSLANARATRKRYLNHEASIKSIGPVYFFFGFLSLGAAVRSQFIADNQFGDAEFDSVIFLIIGLLFTTGYVIGGIGVRKFESWSKVFVGILSGISLIGFPLGTLIHAYILYLVFSAKGSYIFSDEYQAIISATPEIKYKSSYVVFILVMVFVVMTLFCLGIALVMTEMFSN